MNIGYSTIIKSLAFCLILFFFSACQNDLPEEIAQAYQHLPDVVDYNFHIKPILSDRCYKCHGPDDNTREANLRLDIEAAAFAASEAAGHPPFVKGNLKKSLVWQRILSDDPEKQMPPPASNLSLSIQEKALIAKWINQGAEWKAHWAFIPPNKSRLPVLNSDQHPIDFFIQTKLKEKGLQPSPRADKERLLRRVTLDLIGLPPSISEIEAFLVDTSSFAYEKVVDRLLQSKAYGERMALEWMDVARYADSHGLHADGERSMWPWRDWVIKAFNENLPYDDFVSWQMAGDLLPNATREQKLATAFHRNHPINSEFGIVSEEFRVQYVQDRTNTTATAFMGLTYECAACHDHKFDPISQKEYYQLAAFFNNVHELGMIGTDKNFGPLLLLPEPETEQKLSTFSNKIEGLEAQTKIPQEEKTKLTDFIHQLPSQTIPLPSPDGFFPFDFIQQKTDKKGKTTQLIDGNLKARLSGAPELVDGKFGKAIRLDNDFEAIRLSGLGNFDLHQPFSAEAWIKPEIQGKFQTIMGNIGGKNTGWRGWIFYLDSLNRPAMKIVHSHSHNYIHIVGQSPVAVNQWTKVGFTYNGSTKAKA